MVSQKLKSVLAVLVVFACGFFAHVFVDGVLAEDNIHTPLPFSPSTGEDKESPQDLVGESQIHVYSDRVTITGFSNLQWASIADTNSMDPVIDADSNVIEVIPQSSDDISVGDIVSYKSKYATGTIIHRVIEKGVDEEGVYFVMKGDNNKNADPGHIRFDQIRRQVVAIIY